MYRLNRIGCWPLGNLDKALVYDSTADYSVAGHDYNVTDYKMRSINAVVGGDRTKEHLMTTVTLGGLLADNKAVGFGVQINGVEESPQRPIMYAVSGNIQCVCVEKILIECVLGRLDAVPSDSAPVEVSNPQVLPINYNNSGGTQQASINMQFVSDYQDGGTPPATQHPICAFWKISNYNAGAAARLEGLALNIGIHAYREDIDNFDPTRQ